MLNVVQSNRLEVLAREFGLLIARPVGEALQPETVVLPNPGMARWLWLSLAAQHGISANLDTVLPGSFVWRLFHLLLEAVPATSPYEPAVMTWRLHALLRDGRGDTQLAGLGPWHDADERERFELARALAQQFDQYIIYRPDWIHRWRRGEETHWQAELWRRLAQASGADDWAVLRARLERLDAKAVASKLPARVSVFGMPLLSPGYLEVLRWLAGFVDVYFFLPNPCREHWADVVAERDLARRAGVADEKTLYLETGNALLASWGGQARDLIDLIQTQEPMVGHERFIDPGADSLLHTLQQHILELRQPEPDATATRTLPPEDRSVQVHLCHSARREVEVLHDQLLALFDADPSLSASDVIVMSPQIDAHAPYVEAVFRDGRIPYRVADRDPRRGIVLLDSFLALLQLPRERFEANDVLGVLETAPVRRRFGLSAADVARMREWARKTGIRRGLDVGSDGEGLHSWRHGLDRMLLGFAMPGESQGVLSGISPFDEVEGTDALALGALAEFVTRVGALAAGIAEQRTPADWAAWLNRQLEAFFSPTEDEEQDFQLLRDAFAQLASEAQAADFGRLIGFDIAVDWLGDALAAQRSSRGFLGHGVTFCRLVAMRSVPARVVCLLGLDDGVFPRARRRLSFDLIAKAPRRGDRSRRDDDRLAFLEALSNARDVFYLSYVGRDIRDDNERPPAVVVGELLDYCDRAFAGADGKPASAALLVRHPLHPFSRRYFDGSDPRLVSFSGDLCEAAAAAGNEPPPPFVDGPIPVEAQSEVIALDTLLNFFSDPSKFVMREYLQIAYEDDSGPIDTADPLQPGNLEAWQMRQRIVELFEHGHDSDTVLAILQESRFAPAGLAGRLCMEREIEKMASFHAALRHYRPRASRAPLAVDVALSSCRVTGILAALDEHGLYLWRQGNTRAKDRLRAWIEHLVLVAAAPAGIAPRTHWFASDTRFHFDAPDEPVRHLDGLIGLFRRAQAGPVPLFPHAAWEYCEMLERHGDREAARDAARKAFSWRRAGSGYKENNDAYVYRLFGDSFDMELFEAVTRRVLAPLREHLSEGPR